MDPHGPMWIEVHLARQDRNHAKEDEAEEHLLCADAIVENGAGALRIWGMVEGM